MSEPLVRPTLTHVAKALDVPFSTVSSQVQQGHIRSVAKKPGPGRREHGLTAPQTLEFIFFNGLRLLGASNKLLGDRAAAMARAALPILGAAARGELKGGPGYLLIVTGGKAEERILCKDINELAYWVTDAVAKGSIPISVPLAPIFEKLFRVYAVAEAEQKGEATTMPAASAIEPEQDDEAGPEGVTVTPVQVADPGAIGLNLSREGLSLFRRGQGLRISLPPHLLRELARRADALADEIDDEQAAAPRATSWSIGTPTGVVAGNA